MKAAIRIDMGNEAFQGNFAGPELAAILREAASRVATTTRENLRQQTITLLDSNGNGVGVLVITGR